jgi:hypothetical protein
MKASNLRNIRSVVVLVMRLAPLPGRITRDSSIAIVWKGCHARNLSRGVSLYRLAFIGGIGWFGHSYKPEPTHQESGERFRYGLLGDCSCESASVDRWRVNGLKATDSDRCFAQLPISEMATYSPSGMIVVR